MADKIKPLHLDIDPDELILKLKVRDKAQATVSSESFSGIPQEPDDNEKHIVGHFRTQLGKLKAWVQAHYKIQDEVRGAIDIEQDSLRLSNITSAMTAKIGETLVNFEQELTKKRKVERRHQINLNGFKIINELGHEPRYPASKPKHYFVVCIICLAEVVLNTILYAKGSDFGGIGGFMEALMVTAVNLVVAYLAGRFALRWTHHVNRTRARFGWLFMMAYSATATLLNLLAAHYRAVLDSGIIFESIDKALSNAVLHLISGPLQIESMQAWMLFVFGLAASILMLHKAHTDDDVYPGFGDVHRDHSRALDEYDATKRKMFSEIGAIREKTLSDLETAIVLAKKNLTHFLESIDETERMNTYYDATFHLIESCAAIVISAYRSALKDIATLPDHPFFNENFVFTGADATFKTADLVAIRNTYNRYEAALDVMNKTSARLADLIQDQGNTALDGAHELFTRIEQRAMHQLAEDEDLQSAGNRSFKGKTKPKDDSFEPAE